MSDVLDVWMYVWMGLRRVEKMPVELYVRIVGKRDYGYCIFMIERWDDMKQSIIGSIEMGLRSIEEMPVELYVRIVGKREYTVDTVFL